MILCPNAKAEIPTIQETVARTYGIDVTQMLSESRRSHVSIPRMVATVLCLHAGHSTPRTSLAFKRADHTYALYAKRRVYAFMRTNPHFAITVNVLAAECGLDPLEVAA